MLWLFLACTGSPPTSPTPTGPITRPLAPCAFDAPGFDTWSPGGDWDVQYPEDNARYLYTGGGVAVEDFDGDGRFDIFLPGSTRGQLFLARDDGFEDASAWLPALSERGVGASVVDFDADGDLDLYHTALARPNNLLLNQGDHFVDVAPAWSLDDARQSISSSWADMDGDTDLDLFVANFGNQGAERAQVNGLFEARPTTYLERSAELPADFTEAWTFTGGFVDLDGDRLPELYGVNDFGWKIPNQLLWNTGGTFVPDGNASGLDVVIEGMGLGVNDLNDDGVPDLLMSSWMDIVLMQSAGEIWADTADVAGIGPDEETDRVIAWGTALEDLDNDGDLDALVVNGYLRVSENWPLPAPFEQPESLFVNEGGSFVESSAEWGLTDTGASRGFVLADFDDDGALDLVRRDLRGPAILHRGRCAGNAVRVRLQQPGLNRDAIGAEIRLTANGHTQRRWIRSGTTNIASSGPLEAHFGVGDTASVDLTIVWPDGHQEVHEALSTQVHYTFVRR